MNNKDNWNQHWIESHEMIEINPASIYRFQKIAYFVGRYIMDSSLVIDFGSGQGDNIQLLNQHFPNNLYYGLEYAQSGVNIAQNKIPNAKFFQADLIKNTPIITELLGKGDICICSEVLEHVDNPEIMVKNFHQYMQHGAKIIVTVPGGLMNKFEKHIGHRKHYTKNELELLLSQNGFKIIKTYRMGFPFHNIYKLLAWLRGDKIINDGTQKPSTLFKLIFKIFNILYKFNLNDSPWGWQLLTIAERE